MSRGRKTAAAEGFDANSIRGDVAGRHPESLYFARLLFRGALKEWNAKRRAQRPGARRGNPPVKTIDWPYWELIELEKTHPVLARAIARYPGLIPYRDPMEDVFEAAMKSDEAFATFLEMAARQIRAGLHKKAFVDKAKLALREVLENQYQDRPVEIVEVVASLYKLGVEMSERWVSEQSKKLGYEVRKRGRP